MSARPFSQVDVFTDALMRGNPVAVVHDLAGVAPIDDARMQDFARWTNLSETTFLLAPTDPAADYRVRIFTAGGELPFAGHPTLGSCHAWLERGGVPKRAGVVVQECGVGLVTIRRDGSRTAFAAPPLQAAPVDPSAVGAVLAAFGVPPERLVDAQWLRNGPNWLGFLLDRAEAVLALEPEPGLLKAFDKVGFIAPWSPGSECDFEVRAFVCGARPFEDPVTGSLNAGFAQWLIGSGRAPERYLAAQGKRLGRAGRVHVAREGDTIWIGGDCVTGVRGDVSL